MERPIAWVLLGGWLHCGCSEEPFAGTNATDDSGGTTQSTGDSEEGEATCEAVRTAATTPRVLIDTTVDCDDLMFGRFGVSVAASGQGDLGLAASSYWTSRIVHVDAATAEVRTRLPTFGARRVLLDLEQASNRMVASSTRRGSTGELHSALLEVGTVKDEWRPESFEISAWSTDPAIDMVSFDDSLYVWWRSADLRLRVARRQHDTWTLSTASILAGSVDPRFTVDAHGREVALDHVIPDTEITGWRLGARADSRTEYLGPTLDTRPRSFVPIQLAASDPEGRPWAVARGLEETIEILWPIPEGTSTLALPGTGIRRTDCPPRRHESECPPDCHDDSVGRVEDVFSAAASADGTIWVGHVHASFDRVIEHHVLCDEVKGTCACTPVFDDLGSSYSLRLTALRPKGAIEHWLELPLERSPGDDAPLRPGDAIDLHAYGSQLAVAVRGTDDETGDVRVRALLLETSM
jgi:hypothetical protein